MVTMNITQFWQIITIHNSINNKSDELKQRLNTLSSSELEAFDQHYNKILRRIWHWDIWGAAYVTCGCNTEYDFLDFCNWLITQGHERVEKVIMTPDSIVDITDIPFKDNLPYPYCDELDLTPGLLYEEKTGQEMPYHNIVNYAPQGKKFKTKPKLLKTTYPNLYRIFWARGN